MTLNVLGIGIRVMEKTGGEHLTQKGVVLVNTPQISMHQRWKDLGNRTDVGSVVIGANSIDAVCYYQLLDCIKLVVVMWMS